MKIETIMVVVKGTEAVAAAEATGTTTTTKTRGIITRPAAAIVTRDSSIKDRSSRALDGSRKRRVNWSS